MERKICLDTDFLVNFLTNKKEEVDFVRENEASADFATTYLNLFELYYGAYRSKDSQNKLGIIPPLLSRINVLNLSDESVEKAGEIQAKLRQKGKMIKFRDLLIGTIALVNGYSIKTKNIKHFERIEGLTVSD